MMQFSGRAQDCAFSRYCAVCISSPSPGSPGYWIKMPEETAGNYTV